jgi:hypothetical protein
MSISIFFSSTSASTFGPSARKPVAIRRSCREASGRPGGKPVGGRPRAQLEEGPAAAAPEPGPFEVWQESARHWLTEVALAGFQQLEASTLASFLSTLEQLQGEPRAVRLAALLTGFLNEMLEALPVAALPAIPVYRWADLWTRSMLAAVRAPAPPAGRKVGGTLTFLGADLHEHGYFFSCDFYALLEGEDPTRVVRLTSSAYKVSVVSGPDLWCCLPDSAGDLLRGVSQHLTFKVRDMTLLPGGDLLWDGKAEVGREAPFMDLARQRLAPGSADPPAGPVAPPVDRHPVQLAEPVYLGPYTVQGDGAPHLDLGDGVELPVAVHRLARASEIKPEHITASRSLLGLLRFDGGRWEVQPLAVAVEGKKAEVVFTGSGAVTARRSQSKTLATLKERASRLLRQKS